jgi:uncharacterized protein YecE (DUF72 family)
MITHIKKLTNCEEPVEWFFRELEPLKGKISAFLFQLPPSFSPQPEHVSDFISQLPDGNRYVFELRNPAVYSGAVPEILSRYGVTFCIHDYPGRKTPHLATATLVYVRLHGTEGRYSGSYSDHDLSEWASRIRSWSEDGRDVLVYFNNDIGGHAIRNAAALLDAIGR